MDVSTGSALLGVNAVWSEAVEIYTVKRSGVARGGKVVFGSLIVGNDHRKADYKA